jgi:hypothetical protein
VKVIRLLFNFGYAGIVFLFFCSGVVLAFFAAVELWNGINPIAAPSLRDRLNAILEGIGPDHNRSRRS